MIIGAHAVIYSTDARADRALLRDVLGLPSVDAGGGWLIFGLPPAEVAVHPAEKGGAHQLYLLADDIEAFVSAMTARGVACSPRLSLGWGVLTELALPGGGKLGVYQPRHPRPPTAKTTSRAEGSANPNANVNAKAKPKPKMARNRAGRGKAGRGSQTPKGTPRPPPGRRARAT